MMNNTRGLRMRRVFFGFFLGIVPALTAAAELPPSFRGWESRSVLTISIPQLAAAAGNNAAIIREYGFLGCERRVYSRQDARLTATLWRMADATGSYGLFTFYGEPGMIASQDGDDPAASGPGVFLLQRGPYVLEVRGEELSAEDFEELGGSIAKSEGRETLLPPLPGFLPDQGLIPKSEKYLIGALAFHRVLDRIPPAAIRFDLGAEAALAHYRMGERMADTEQLLNRIGYETDIMWNEYVPAPGENAGSMMLAVLSLAGFVLLIALFSGLAFGGLRLVVKRFVPIPVFDRPTNLEIIRLH